MHNPQQHIFGMDISNVQCPDGSVTIKYIEATTLSRFMADYQPFLTEDQFFNMACDYLEMFDTETESCCSAKIQETHYF